MIRLRSIRTLLPLGVLAVALLAILFSLQREWRQVEHSAYEQARGALTRDSFRLALQARRTLHEHPGWIADDLTRWTSDRRAVAAALVDPDGRVRLGSAAGWSGQAAAAAITGFPSTAFARSQSEHGVQFNRSRGDRLQALLGFDLPTDQRELRPDRAAIYLEFDLTRVLAEARHEALAAAAPTLLAFFCLSLLLLEIVDRALTGPLQRLQRAVAAMSEGDSDPALPVEGAPEVRELILAFTAMRARVQRTLVDLRRQEQHLNAAQQIARVGSWERLLDAREGWWSPEMYRILGLDPGSVAADHYSVIQRVHVDDRPALDELYQRALLQGEAYRADYRLLRSDGQQRVLHDEVQPLLDPQQQRIGLRGTLQDITERKAIEAAWRESEQRVRSVLESTLDAVITIDEQGRVSAWNRQAEQLFGWSEVEALQRPVHELVIPEALRAAHLQGLRSHLAGAPARLLGQRVELQALHRDGRLLEIELSLASFRIEGALQFSAFIRDIGARKRAEAELHSINAMLEQRIEQRTGELLRAKDEAETASRAKTEFLSRMSHELRTPMNAVLGFAQLLSTDTELPLQPLQRANVEEITRAGTHLLQLIDEILDLARIESGRLDLRIEAVDLQPLLAQALGLLAPLADSAHVRLPPTPPAAAGLQVQADPMRLSQVLINLLSNAIKYNQPGGRVELRCRLDPPGWLRIEVEDSGRGIATRDLPRLFQAFERLDSAYAGIGGSGIGLALCKRLVEAMSGRIGVSSEAGRGSLFWIELPVTDLHPRRTPDAATDAASAVAAAPLPLRRFEHDRNPQQRMRTPRPGQRDGHPRVRASAVAPGRIERSATAASFAHVAPARRPEHCRRLRVAAPLIQPLHRARASARGEHLLPTRGVRRG